MKKYILFVFLFFSSINSYSQIGIFQHLNEIKNDDNGLEGKLERVPDKDAYIYHVVDTNLQTYFFYALTFDLYCYMSIVKPMTSLSMQTWIQHLNKEWVIVDDNNWKYYRNDGVIILCELTFDGEYPSFLFSIKENKK